MRATVAFAVAIAILAACSDDSSKPATSASSSARVVPPSSSSSLDFASAVITFDGDVGLKGTAVSALPRCTFPTVDGPAITVIVTPIDSSMLVRLSITNDAVTAKVSKGTGGTFVERDFRGTGVSGFAPAKGVHLDGPLTEVAVPSGVRAGTLGTLTALSGSVDCGASTSGSTTITLTGDLGTTTLDHAALGDALVECNPSDGEVVISAIVRNGTFVRFTQVALRSDGVAVEFFDGDQKAAQYQGSPGSAKVTDTGGTANGDALERAAESPLHTLHVEGEATCGSYG